MKKHIIIMLAFLFAGGLFAQDHKDKAMFKEYEPSYYINSILKDVRDFDEKQEPKKVDKRFFMDQSDYDLPDKINLYKQFWHQPTISQGNAGTCWCFSTTSFFESEIYRFTGQKIKLSEIYTVYWEYVEKARRFVEERGNSLFDQGSEGNAVSRIYKQYGIVPWDVYNGLAEGRKFHTHKKMFREMKSYLGNVKKEDAWNMDIVLGTIKDIMNHYIGEPPASFEYDGKTYTPREFLSDVTKLNMDDYVEILSCLQEPYWEKVEYKVPDNWWHSKDYYNVPLDVYMQIVKKSIRDGYTMTIGGDVSEAGFLRTTNCAMIPTFDIPVEYIDENARQFRFSNKTSTDDHGMHLVGWLSKDGTDWYLVKDSSSGSRNNDEDAPEFGYYFFRDDFVKLKILNITVHKDEVKDILKKFKE